MSKYKYTITQQSEILTFGKHKHQTIQHILRTDPSYILWLDQENIVQFPSNIINLATDKMDDMRYEHSEWEDLPDESD